MILYIIKINLNTNLFVTHCYYCFHKQQTNFRVPTTSPLSPFSPGPIQTRSKHQPTTLTMKNSMGKSTDLHCHEECYGNRMEGKETSIVDVHLLIRNYPWNTVKISCIWVSSKNHPSPKIPTGMSFCTCSTYCSLPFGQEKFVQPGSTTPFIHPDVCHRCFSWVQKNKFHKKPCLAPTSRRLGVGTLRFRERPPSTEMLGRSFFGLTMVNAAGTFSV